MAQVSEGMQREDGVYPEGEYTAWSTPDGMRSEIRKDGRRVGRVLTGEMSHSDAVRKAGDLNRAAEMSRFKKDFG